VEIWNKKREGCEKGERSEENKGRCKKEEFVKRSVMKLCFDKDV
jgi:hypothetical protein